MLNFIQWLEAWNQNTRWTPEEVAKRAGGEERIQLGREARKDTPQTDEFPGLRGTFPDTQQKIKQVVNLVGNYYGFLDPMGILRQPMPKVPTEQKGLARKIRWLIYALLVDVAKVPPDRLLHTINMSEKTWLANKRKMDAARQWPEYEEFARKI